MLKRLKMHYENLPRAQPSGRVYFTARRDAGTFVEFEENDIKHAFAFNHTREEPLDDIHRMKKWKSGHEIETLIRKAVAQERVAVDEEPRGAGVVANKVHGHRAYGGIPI